MDARDLKLMTSSYPYPEAKKEDKNDGDPGKANQKQQQQK